MRGQVAALARSSPRLERFGLEGVQERCGYEQYADGKKKHTDPSIDSRPTKHSQVVTVTISDAHHEKVFDVLQRSVEIRQQFLNVWIEPIAARKLREHEG
jgi:hypothetical protein